MAQLCPEQALYPVTKAWFPELLRSYSVGHPVGRFLNVLMGPIAALAAFMRPSAPGVISGTVMWDMIIFPATLASVGWACNAMHLRSSAPVHAAALRHEQPSVSQQRAAACVIVLVLLLMLGPVVAEFGDKSAVREPVRAHWYWLTANNIVFIPTMAVWMSAGVVSIWRVVAMDKAGVAAVENFGRTVEDFLRSPPRGGELADGTHTREGDDIAAATAAFASFDDACELVAHINSIFAVPVSIVFTMLTAWLVWLAVETAVPPEDEVDTEEATYLYYLTNAVFLTIFAGCWLCLLGFVAKLGDTWAAVSAVLLRPSTVMRLVDRLGPRKTKLLFQSIVHTELGFDLMGVAATSGKVIWLVGSAMGGVLYLLPYLV